MAGSPTMRRRRLARELRQLRSGSGMSIDDVSAQLEWPSSKLSRIETRKLGISASDLGSLLDLYGVTDEDLRAKLIDMARRAKERGWWETYGATIPTETRTMIGIESEASGILTYQPELITGLLQTPAYARKVIRAARPNDTQEEIERRVEVRLARQDILTTDHPPQLRVVLSEGAVRRVVGGRDVMVGQLRHLAAERDRLNVVVQVLPFASGEHPAMVGPFTIFEFPDPEDVGVVYVETMTSSVLLEKPEDLEGYRDSLARVQAEALSPGETRAMLNNLADELS